MEGQECFRVLKSGCRTEFLLFRTAERLQRVVAINAVIAWRIMVMTLLGREVPDCEPSLMFTDEELDFLRDHAEQHAMPAPVQPSDAVQLVAHLGGYRNRKHDRDPGHQIMWHGQTRLSSAALGHRIGFMAGQRHALRKKIRLLLCIIQYDPAGPGQRLDHPFDYAGPSTSQLSSIWSRFVDSKCGGSASPLRGISRSRWNASPLLSCGRPFRKGLVGGPTDRSPRLKHP